MSRQSECPEAPHAPRVDCERCGYSGRGFRFGERIAPWASLAIVLAVAVVVVLALTGCSTGAGATPEDEYLNEVYAAAKAEGFDWSAELEDTALALADSVCFDIGHGLPVEQVRAEAMERNGGETPEGRVISVAVDAAVEHVCEVAS